MGVCGEVVCVCVFFGWVGGVSVGCEGWGAWGGGGGGVVPHGQKRSWMLNNSGN